eukprot:gene7093-430_t
MMGWQRLLAEIQSAIVTTGPMTVASYMKHVLTHPIMGYYARNDPFKGRGDFVTSPQLTQIFGEMVGAWSAAEWLACCKPYPVHLVELGPGTGLLMHDIVKTFTSTCKPHVPITDVHLVESNSSLSRQQFKTLGCGEQPPDFDDDDISRERCYLSGIGINGIRFHWYRHLNNVDDIPGFAFLFANEFFDALPTHQFQRTDQGWRERLIDICDNSATGLRFVLSPQETPHSKVFEHLPFVRRAGIGDIGESSFAAMELAERVALTLHNACFGGRSLIIDYGSRTKFDDTFRAYRKHQQVDVLDKPGTADLTTDVNFDLLIIAMEKARKAYTYGPISQRSFLIKCGINERVVQLANQASDPKVIDAVRENIHFLIDGNGAGQRFQVLAASSPGKEGLTVNTHPILFAT